MTRTLAAVALAVLFALEAHAADLHARVLAVYDFRPRDLSEAAQTKKSAELDAFWNEVKKGGAPLLAQLRAELRRNDVPRFFSYDGAKLLLSLSRTAEDETLAIGAIARADPRDVQPDDFFFTLHDLAKRGRDVTPAAFTLLDDPEFEVFVPKHVLQLDRTGALFFLLLPLDESIYVPRTIEQLAKAKDVETQKTLINLLGYAVDARADDAIRKFARDATKPNESRALASAIADSFASMPAPPARNVANWRKQRRLELKHVSDEAIAEAQRLTALMRGARQQ